MLCYAVWDISHQVLLHRLAQPTSSSATPSSMAHLKLCPHHLVQLISSYATQSSAAHLKLCYIS